MSFAADHVCIFQQSLKTLNPGGWLEVHEWVIRLQSNNYKNGRGKWLKLWNELAIQGEYNSFPAMNITFTLLNPSADARKKFGTLGAAALGHDTAAPEKFPKQMKQLGYRNVVQFRYVAHVSPWAPEENMRELSEMGQQNMLRALQPFTLATIGKGLGWGNEDMERLLEMVKIDLHDESLHAYCHV